MEQQKYITDQEMVKCQKVAQVFNDLYDQTDIVVLNADKYGFAILKDYDMGEFHQIDTYTDSNELFESLWREWLEERLLTLCIQTPLINLDYEDMFKSLPKESQNEIEEIRKHFLDKIDCQDENLDTTESRESYIYDVDKDRCRIVADLFRNDLEKANLLLKDIGKYGFIMMQYYEPIANFDSSIIFTDSKKMFDTLLNEWFVSKIAELREEKQMTNMDIDIFYDKLPKEIKDSLKKKKDKFAEQARKKATFLKN